MKKLKLANVSELADYERALFQLYRTEELARRGTPQLDIDMATGLPANPQITTAYEKGDPVTLEIDVDPRAEGWHNRVVMVDGRPVRLNFTPAVNKP